MQSQSTEMERIFECLLALAKLMTLHSETTQIALEEILNRLPPPQKDSDNV